MNFKKSEEQIQWCKEIADFAHSELNEGLKNRLANQSFDRRLWQKCGQFKLQGLPVDESLGGRAMDPLSMVLALEALAENCTDSGLCFSLTAHLLASTVPLWKFGSAELREKYLEPMCDGSLIAANAMTEESSGSDVYNMSTTAIRDGDNYILNGKKIFITNAPVSDVVIIYAITDEKKGFFGGITAFLLDKKIHNYYLSDRENKFGVKSCMMGQVQLENVKVNKSFIIGQEGGGAIIFNTSMIWEKTCLGSIHLGAMSRAFKETKEYIKNRKLNSQSIASFQVVKHKMSELHTLIVSTRWPLYQAASALSEGKKMDLISSTTKLLVSENYKKFAAEIFQLYGGQAIVNDHFAAHMLSDAYASTIYSGTSEIQKNIISQTLGIK
jgi:hypothetical protein